MNCWVITVGEPLPIDGNTSRVLRSGILAKVLADRGHDVTWWTSTFDHWRKIHHAEGHATHWMAPNYRIVLLRGSGYARNVSLARIIEHRRVAEAFTRLAATAPRPDLIVCSLPTLELSAAAVRFGRRHRVPVVIDVRDMWPDVLARVMPAPLRPLAGLATAPLRRLAREACAGAIAITGHAPAFVEWGVSQAGRALTPRDRAFPFGYVARVLSATELADANKFWSSLGLWADPRYLTVVFAGTMSHSFDFAPLLAAAPQLSGAARFVLCGTGDSFESVRRQSAGLSNVLCPGWVGEVHLAALLRKADIGMAPYRDEPDFRMTIPNKGPEYLAAGLPIALSLDGGPLFDLVQRQGCGFSYDASADLLVKLISELARDRQRLLNMAANARRVFNRFFRAEVVYGEFAAFLEQLIC